LDDVKVLVFMQARFDSAQQPCFDSAQQPCFDSAQQPCL